MTRRISPLLCELHAHTTWSDGALSLTELVDLYGRSGFDVLCVTDHVVRDGRSHVHAGNVAAYLGAIQAEALRARAVYDLLLVPGLELTYDDPDPRLAAHAVAVGLRELPSLANGLEPALRRARDAGAALVAAHPIALELAETCRRATAAWHAQPDLHELVDRFELFNRHTLYSWVSELGLPAVASGDFHRRDHLGTWKTLIPCEKDERAIVDYLRSRRPTYLAQLGEPVVRRLVAA
jgi:predicted metal-dependent phosphoesterase TrpH